MAILYLILGIALVVVGLILCILSPVPGILAAIFGVLLIVFSRKAKKDKKAAPVQPAAQEVPRPAAPDPKPEPKPASPAPAKKPVTEPENHYLIDVNEPLIMKYAEPNDDYKCTKRELVDLGYADESIYKFETITVPAVVEEDAVIFQGEPIGRIKTGSLSHVRKALADPLLDHADLVVYGGPHKYISEDVDDNDRYVYEVTSYADAPFKAALKIYMKK